jgi:peroxiredoxin
VVRGAFGLMCGPGEAAFRNIRLLARDPFDPAARIERELAMQRVREDATQRQAGSFAGFVPPELEGAQWQQGEETILAELRGKPLLLAFWSPRQDALIPCTEFFNHLAERGQAAGLQVLVVCSSGTTPESLAEYLQQHPMPKARIALDAGNKIYDAYYVKAGHHGLPRVLLLDAEGKVTFEGDPGLKSGVGWRPGDGETYVEAAFRKLIGASAPR